MDNGDYRHKAKKEHGGPRLAVQFDAQVIRRGPMTEKEYIEAAKYHHVNDTLEIDPDAKVSMSEHGAWVEAWVWVDKEEDDD